MGKTGQRVNSDSTTMQKAFVGSAGVLSERGSLLMGLPELRRTDFDSYWNLAHHLPPPSLDDLEEMMPQATLPQLVDGSIPYRFQDHFGPDPDAIAERQMRSQSATQAARFLELVEHLEKRDPSFMADFAASLSSFQATEYALNLHLMAERDDLKQLFLGKVRHMDDLVIEVGRRRETYLDNQYIPMDNQFIRMMDDLVYAYIQQRAPMQDNEVLSVKDQDIRPFLELARDYGDSYRLTELINTKLPLPDALVSAHFEGFEGMRVSLRDETDMALWFLDKRDRYAGLTDAEKTEFATYYLHLLAHSYGIDPPQTLEIDPALSSDGGQSTWDTEDRAACFAHPLGKVTLREFPETFDELLSTLSHEFCHGLEDAALFSINSEYSLWRKEQPEAPPLGSEVMSRNLRAAALPIAFNTAVGREKIFSGIGQDATMNGTYYRPAGAPRTESGQEEPEREREARTRANKLYLTQLRERHAFLYQDVIAAEFTRIMDRLELSRDPLRVHMMAQLATYKADDFLKEKFIPAIPEGRGAAFMERIDKLRQHFRDADSRDASYDSRMRHMGIAFIELKLMMRDGKAEGFINLREAETSSAFSLFGTVADHAVQAIRYLEWKKDRAERHAAAGVGAAPA